MHVEARLCSHTAGWYRGSSPISYITEASPISWVLYVLLLALQFERALCMFVSFFLAEWVDALRTTLPGLLDPIACPRAWWRHAARSSTSSISISMILRYYLCLLYDTLISKLDSTACARKNFEHRKNNVSSVRGIEQATPARLLRRAQRKNFGLQPFTRQYTSTLM
jgi:hypothetical protein